MPIYAYKCESCGYRQDVLQKISATPLHVCPQCAAETFKKQLSAPGFQLKGSGWYVTDFRDNKDKSSKTEGAAGLPANDNKEAASTNSKVDASTTAPSTAAPTVTPTTAHTSTPAPTHAPSTTSSSSSTASKN